MRKLAIALAVTLAVAANSGIALAQGTAPIDLKGRWTAISDAISTGRAPHHAMPQRKGPQLDHIGVTYEITGQDGRRFWGSVAFKRGGSEPLIGVIGFDGRSIVARDRDGIYEGTVVDGDTLDIIYSHGGADSSVVAAHRFKRQR